MQNKVTYIIEIKDLEIGYLGKKKKHSVFKNINLNARKGELIGLIGRNGVGKSTLLKSITRLNKSIKGSVLLNNKLIEEYDINSWAKELSFVSSRVKTLVSCTVEPYFRNFGNSR